MERLDSLIIISDVTLEEILKLDKKPKKQAVAELQKIIDGFKVAAKTATGKLKRIYKEEISRLERAMNTFQTESVEMNEDLRLTPKDKKVIISFINQKGAESNKFDTDGKQLDGNWMGGKNLAHWKGTKIVMGNLGSRSAQTVQTFIRKTAGKEHVNESTADFRKKMEFIQHHKLAKPWVNDPMFLDIIKSKDEKALTKALSTAKSIRGNSGLTNFRKVMKKILDLMPESVNESTTKFKKGDKVLTDNGQYKGTITKVLTGRNKGQYEVKLKRGTKVVDHSDLTLDEMASVGAGTIPTGPESVGVKVKPDFNFKGLAGFDCSANTFGKCLQGKKKFKRWNTYLDRNSELVGKVKNYMGQSYKNTNFVLRNSGTGEMVVARRA